MGVRHGGTEQLIIAGAAAQYTLALEEACASGAACGAMPAGIAGGVNGGAAGAPAEQACPLEASCFGALLGVEGAAPEPLPLAVLVHAPEEAAAGHLEAAGRTSRPHWPGGAAAAAAL